MSKPGSSGTDCRDMEESMNKPRFYLYGKNLILL